MIRCDRKIWKEDAKNNSELRESVRGKEKVLSIRFIKSFAIDRSRRSSKRVRWLCSIMNPKFGGSSQPLHPRSRSVWTRIHCVSLTRMSHVLSILRALFPCEFRVLLSTLSRNSFYKWRFLEVQLHPVPICISTKNFNVSFVETPMILFLKIVGEISVIRIASQPPIIIRFHWCTKWKGGRQKERCGERG